MCSEHTHKYGTYYNGQTIMSQNSDVSCTPEYSPSAASNDSSLAAPPGPMHEPPVAGGGFQLGSNVAVTRAACEGAGQQWQQLSASKATCSGAATPIGVPTQAELGFCSAALCRITLVHTPDSSWLNVIAELRTKLESKYGAPGIRQGNVPEECRAAEAFVGCLKTRRVRLRYGWSWGSGQSITLLIGVPLEDTVPAIRITYAGAASSGVVNESAL